MKKVLISDVTLRDGNHALMHKIDRATIGRYCNLLNDTGVDICEIGHGNGIGASSVSIGGSALDYQESLKTHRDKISCNENKDYILNN